MPKGSPISAPCELFPANQDFPRAQTGHEWARNDANYAARASQCGRTPWPPLESQTRREEKGADEPAIVPKGRSMSALLRAFSLLTATFRGRDKGADGRETDANRVLRGPSQPGRRPVAPLESQTRGEKKRADEPAIEPKGRSISALLRAFSLLTGTFRGRDKGADGRETDANRVLRGLSQPGSNPVAPLGVPDARAEKGRLITSGSLPELQSGPAHARIARAEVR